MEAPRAQKSTLKNFKKIATLFEKNTFKTLYNHTYACPIFYSL